jgi:chromate reductase
MISIISGTYRKDNLSILFSELYIQLSKEYNEEMRLFDLRNLPTSFLLDNSIFGKPSNEFNNMLKTYFVEPEKYVFLIPEYNGSYPGIVKALIDTIDPSVFKGKKAALVGISSGRAGNLRGMDHLTGVLNYLGVQVMPYQLPISRIYSLMDQNKKITDESTIQAMKNHINKFLQF